MTENEIREAVEIIKTRKPCELRFKAEGILLTFAEEYLNLKGWPEERGFLEKLENNNPYLTEDWNDGFNAALRLCKLAAMKEKSRVSEEIRNILSQPPDRISKITIEDYAQIRQKILELINGKEA